MSFLDRFLGQATAAFASVAGDKKFLAAAAAITANVAAADGNISDNEQDAALLGIMNSPVVKGHFSPAEIQEAFDGAVAQAKTRAGRLQNNSAIEAMSSRDPGVKQALFLMGADVADDNGIGTEERAQLDKIAAALGLNAEKLLAV